MFQRRGRKLSPRIFRRAIVWSVARWCMVAIALGGGACDDDGAAPPKPSPTSHITDQTTVASLVPAATDLLLGMGAGDQLVAVSNWDADRAEIARLPRVGGYRSIDWEKLASIRPDVMSVHVVPEKMHAGVSSRAEEMVIELVNLKIGYLEEVLASLDQLGRAIGQPEKASKSARDLRAELEAVRASVAGKPTVRKLISRS